MGLDRYPKVTIATPGQRFEFRSWDEDIELFDGITFNIGRFLEEEGVRVED